RIVTGLEELDVPRNGADALKANPEESALFQEMQLIIFTALRALPPKLRAVIVLRYYLELDDKSIAAIVGCPLGTVKWRLHSAKRQLRTNPAIHGLVSVGR